LFTYSWQCRSLCKFDFGRIQMPKHALCRTLVEVGGGNKKDDVLSPATTFMICPVDAELCCDCYLLYLDRLLHCLPIPGNAGHSVSSTLVGFKCQNMLFAHHTSSNSISYCCCAATVSLVCNIEEGDGEKGGTGESRRKREKNRPLIFFVGGNKCRGKVGESEYTHLVWNCGCCCMLLGSGVITYGNTDE
jgi:hypothetical protein